MNKQAIDKKILDEAMSDIFSDIFPEPNKRSPVPVIAALHEVQARCCGPKKEKGHTKFVATGNNKTILLTDRNDNSGYIHVCLRLHEITEPDDCDNTKPDLCFSVLGGSLSSTAMAKNLADVFLSRSKEQLFEEFSGGPAFVPKKQV